MLKIKVKLLGGALVTIFLLLFFSGIAGATVITAGDAARTDAYSVPEPGFYGVLSIGLGGLFTAVKARRNKQSESESSSDLLS